MYVQKIDTYAKAYVEILEIIKNMEQNYRDKIPQKLIRFFEENKDSNYNYSLSQSETFSQKTIDLLAMLELKYLATDREKELLEDALEKNEIKYQKELREKYNPDNLFKSTNKPNDTIEQIVTNDVEMIEYKESLFKKIWNKLLNIFKR